MDYGEYLRLDSVLRAQKPVSSPAHHDETLFIIQHQPSELWMKLIIHELSAAISFIEADELESCFKILARVKHVQRMLFEQWAVLETLTPSEYMEFRDALGSASGFQSYQFRMIEFLMGNKERDAIRVFEHKETLHKRLTNVLESPSLYDEFLRHLARQGKSIPSEVIMRDWSQQYELNDQVVEVFREIYENPHDNWNAYEMAEKLVDIDQHMSMWRYRHMLTVERIIGYRQGTGGSSGVSFLRKAVDIRLFPELWAVRTSIRAPREPNRKSVHN
ncbi:MAG: tryptophan 2,3-dioxygenase family protein [Fimbriimonadaceae bacterium]